jgi:hypothetical protein
MTVAAGALAVRPVSSGAARSVSGAGAGDDAAANTGNEGA